MPSVAAWLLARPYNAVFAIAITTLMPGLATVSGAILVLLVVQQDIRKALLTVALAGLLLVVVAVLSGTSPVRVIVGLGSSWLPVLGLAWVLRSTRSLTLTLQLSVLIVLIGTCAFFVFVSDPVGFWQEVIASTPLLQELRLPEWQVAIGASAEQFAGMLTTMSAIGVWFGLIVVVLLGYWLFQQLPKKSQVFGRFSDLNFGRVVALLLAITSVAGFAFNVMWIQSIAFILFAVFWVQGAAMMHWLRATGVIPVIGLFAFYSLMIMALVIVDLGYIFPAVAVIGYTDAWFRYRDRVTKQQ
jgi:hypothetical protein